MSTIEQQIANIKANMPETYRAITARAADSDLGRNAYALVRRSLKGEPNCFYAMERGHVVGTPFVLEDEFTVMQAKYMLRFGCTFMVMWAPVTAIPSATQGG